MFVVDTCILASNGEASLSVVVDDLVETVHTVTNGDVTLSERTAPLTIPTKSVELFVQTARHWLRDIARYMPMSIMHTVKISVEIEIEAGKIEAKMAKKVGPGPGTVFLHGTFEGNLWTFAPRPEVILDLAAYGLFVDTLQELAEHSKRV